LKAQSFFEEKRKDPDFVNFAQKKVARTNYNASSTNAAAIKFFLSGL